jgi:hypothetical protein
LLGLRKIRLRSIDSELVEMLIEGSSLQLGEVKGDRLGVVGILSQQLVSAKMVFGEIDQLLRRGSGGIWEDLGVDMAG